MALIKRGKIDFGGGNTIFRISKPGIDVDAATPDQLILDERVFYGQLYAAGFVANTDMTITHVQTVFFPALAFAPLAMCFPVMESKIVWPTKYYYKTGLGGALVSGTAYYTTTSTLVYNFAADNVTSGFYYLIFRRGT
ncbi:hypothetical protein ACVDG5_018350 [Mesorhizobium sp. ORM6]